MSTPLTSLDFDTLKTNFKNYLTSQSVFKDYNFDSSNMNVLLDVMSYNTYLNSFYLNMVSSEMFLDSAQKYDSVVSHAKELNYVPTSAKSSEATVNFTIATTGISSPFSIPLGTKFTGTNSNGTYTFTTAQNYNFTSANSTFAVNDLRIFEGTYVQDAFVVDYGQESQKFILSNPNIDTSSLSITVIESAGNTVFTKAETLYNLTSASNIFFLQAAQNGQYEIVFGDGYFGRIPDNLSVMTALYRVADGAAADGINAFTCTQDLGITNGGTATLSTITVTSTSSSGSSPQSIDSIKFSAPRYFATQQRAVASDDYKTLVLNNFGGQLDDVNVYGGELLEPKQYGRVIVNLKPAGGTVAANYLKDEVSNYLADYIALPTRVIIGNPEYLYLVVNSTVQYTSKATTKLASEVTGIITNAINQFGIDHLGKFGNDFRYSKFVAHIDNSDVSINSNNTEVNIAKRLTPKLYYPTSYVIDYNNSAESEHEAIAGYAIHTLFSDEPMITSSSFTYVMPDGAEYTQSFIRDDNIGGLVVYTVLGGVFTVLNNNVGTVNYSTGIVAINNLITAYYDNHISLYLNPLNKDIVVNKDKILLIDLADVSVNLIETLK